QVYVHDRDSDGDGIFDEPDGMTTSLVSVGLGGAPADQMCRRPRISADGRYVMFESAASNLHPAVVAPNYYTHLYVDDRLSGQTTLIDRAVTGAPSVFGVWGEASDMSEDGRFVTYSSASPDILSIEGPLYPQVFRYDAAAQSASATVMVTGRDGLPANGASYATSVSADG